AAAAPAGSLVPAGREAPGNEAAEDDADGEAGGDMEPVDPAEQRPQKMPPERPAGRAVAAETWVALGPSPTQSAQVAVPPDNEVSGAIHAIAAHPGNADILYVGAVNGGIWKTTNATAARPTWTPQTDNLPSQSIGAIAFDPTDGTNQTLIAGIGRFSNFAQRGDDELGVYRTTNGGASWTLHGGSTLLGQKIIAVAARGPTLLAASTTGGLFRSTNTGSTFGLASGTGGLPTGGIFDLVGNRTNANQLYIAVRGSAPKVLRSDDGGATWNDVTAGIANLSSATGAIRLAVGPSNVVFAAIVNSNVLAGVVRSTNLGATWTPMDVPSIHPGAQGNVNTSIAADPSNANLVYLGGDRITASPFTGNTVRGDASLAAGSQFAIIHGSGAGGTSPHADSRAMAFDANGALLESDDGGIYRRSTPGTTGTWSSVIGNLAVTEVHDLAHDRVANVIMIGTQDNGTHMQQAAANPRWTMINGGDGGDAAIDDDTLGIAGSYRYISSQNSGGFRRTQYSAANAVVGNLALPAIADPQFVTPVELNATTSTRMLVGGTNTLYESTNIATGTPTFTSLGTPGANRNAMAYGAANDPDAAYVGKGAAVFRRQGASFVATAALPSGAATVTDVAMDPDDSQLVFAIDDNQVFRSVNGGTSWQDVTGNLGAVSSQDFRTIEFIPSAFGDGVALGTRSGVYYAAANSGSWSLLGSGLPDVLVFDLRYVASSGQLIAGTLGRGVWSLAVVTDRIFANGFQQ
ncbi:hypothetical protein, partial [Tahibacter caeni]|uniref:hypothetical protein n=1 Tax=Tahibacter caeni TaxID=1453545 RepID=UPI00214752FF